MFSFQFKTIKYEKYLDWFWENAIWSHCCLWNIIQPIFSFIYFIIQKKSINILLVKSFQYQNINYENELKCFWKIIIDHYNVFVFLQNPISKFILFPISNAIKSLLMIQHNFIINFFFKLFKSLYNGIVGK